jgi:hypothetical protein
MTEMVDSKKPMAVVNIPYKYQDVLLNADDAYTLFKIMHNAVPVTYDYGDHGYKPNATTDRPTLKGFTVEDYAVLALNSEPQ